MIGRVVPDDELALGPGDTDVISEGGGHRPKSGGRRALRVAVVVDHHDVQRAAVGVGGVDGIRAQHGVWVQPQHGLPQAFDLQPDVLTRGPAQSVQSRAAEPDAAHSRCQRFDLADGCGEEHRVAQRADEGEAFDEGGHGEPAQ